MNSSQRIALYIWLGIALLAVAVAPHTAEMRYELTPNQLPSPEVLLNEGWVLDRYKSVGHQDWVFRPVFLDDVSITQDSSRTLVSLSDGTGFWRLTKTFYDRMIGAHLAIIGATVICALLTLILFKKPTVAS